MTRADIPLPTRASGRHLRTPLRIHWGEQAANQLGTEISRTGARRVVLVTSPSVAPRPELAALLETGGIEPAAVFSEAAPHSPLDTVGELAGLLGAVDADGVLVVGGGSAMVTARAAVIGHAEGTDFAALATRVNPDGTVVSPRLERAKIPIVIVPTNPTTAMAKAGAALTRPGCSGRLSLFDPKVRAQALLIVPELLDGAPAAVQVAASSNALVMAIEGLMAPASTPFSDAALLRAMTIIRQWLGADAEGGGAGVQLALAAVLVGEGTDVAGGGAVAALSHILGHELAQSNGVVDAVLLPSLLDLPQCDAPSQVVGLSRVAALSGDQDLPNHLRSLFSRLGFPSRLSEMGLERAEIPRLARAATGDFSFLARADLTQELLEAVLYAAW